MKKFFSFLLTAALMLNAGICFATPPNAVPTVIPDGIEVGSGDVDGNGSITPSDAFLAWKVVNGDQIPKLQEFLKADVNFNGRIDWADVYGIWDTYLAGGAIQLPFFAFLEGDANGDGEVTPEDALVLTEYLQSDWDSPVIRVYNADANQDYFIDQRDVDEIMDIYLGK